MWGASRVSSDATRRVNRRPSPGYRELAAVYDWLMAGLPYDQWVAYIEHMVRRLGRSVVSVLDLGCGTGLSTLPWAARGYAVTGLDSSLAMLEVASRKPGLAGISLVQEDMRSFDLGRAFDPVVAVHDTINHLLDAQDLKDCFRSVARHQPVGGLLFFDSLTPAYLAEASETTFFDDDDYTVLWEATPRDGAYLSVEVIGFIRRGDRHHKFRTEHRERVYSQSELVDALTAAGYEAVAFYDAFTDTPADATSRRLSVVARKKGSVEREADCRGVLL